ncbi:hypothetical protein MKW92_048782 [Papaver armeniacum]|nr:hypothetical protein MKW92_048782 [Papaver armeniacum]
MGIWKYDPDVMDVLVDLIIRLATSRRRICRLVFGHARKQFYAAREQVLDQVHKALLKITNLVPLKKWMTDDFDDGFVLVNQANVFAEKLDSLMVLTCQHIRSCAENGRLLKVFNTLLQTFYDTVLNTQRSKFAQFFMFYACSLDPEECGVSFAFMLADIFYCNTENPLTRMSSVAYLASYLARAIFLEGRIIACTLRRLKALDPEAHRLFYSGCQAVLYVLCFRMREMLDDPHLKSVIFGFPLQLIFRHPLDPLKVCLPSIVEEFLQQAKAASLFTASEHFIFKNLLKSSEAFGGGEKLDMFFPFDPFLLEKSDRFCIGRMLTDPRVVKVINQRSFACWRWCQKV